MWMNNPMLGKPRTPGTGNPVSRYAKPQPGSSSPDKRYAQTQRTKTTPRTTPTATTGARNFVDKYLETVRPSLRGIGQQIGRAAEVALAMEPAARAVRGAGNRAMLQSPASSRGKFLQRVYADQQMPANDMPIVRAITGKQSPFAKAHGAGFGRAMDEFKRTHKWAREARNKTDVEFAVNYLLSKKHKRYYNP